MTARYRLKNSTRYYRCESCATTSDGEGFGRDNAGRPRTTLRASEVEAGVVLWGLALLDDPQRLREFVAAYDREVMGTDDDALAVRRAEDRIRELTERIGELRKGVGAGLWSVDEVTKDLNALNLARSDADAVLARLTDARAQSDALHMSIENLLSLKVEKNEGQPDLYDIDEWLPVEKLPGEITPGGSLSWETLRDWLRSEATEVWRIARSRGTVGGRPPKSAPSWRELDATAQEWAEAFADIFELCIVVTDDGPTGWGVEGAIPSSITASWANPGTPEEKTARRHGGPASSTRSTRGPSRTRRGMASVISTASPSD
jgi:hypothetical protein